MDKERLLSHGQYPIVSLAKARKKRDEAKRQTVERTDPTVQKRLDELEAQTASRMTFKLVAEECIESLVERILAPATLRKNRWYLLDLAGPIHNRPVNEITSAELLYLLKSIERSGRRETAKKLRGAMSAVFRSTVVTLRAENEPTFVLRGALARPR